MQPMRIRDRSGSRASAERTEPTPAWEREWLEADAVDRAEAARAKAARPRVALRVVGPAAVLAAAVAAVFPVADSYWERTTSAAVAAAALVAAVSVLIVPLARTVAATASERWRRADLVIFSVALLSAGAASIHFAVAKDHFAEYTLYGLFFVGSGIAQLGWAVWLLLRPSRPLLALGAAGNLLIVALWAVDRIWGLPIGPEHWSPDPIGFGDSVASGFEVVLAAGCLSLLTGRSGRQEIRTGAARSAAAGFTLVVIALTAASLLSAIGVASSVITPSA